MKDCTSKILITLLTFFSVAQIVWAGGSRSCSHYEQMWESVRKAFNDDLPKTALQRVITIRERAVEEGNQSQLLRALCSEYTLAHEISPDSDAVVCKRIEEALAAEKRPVERALWQNVLGQLTHDGLLLLASLDNGEALADAKAQEYVPAFVIGNDSYVFGDDLLHILCDVAMEFRSYGTGGISRAEKVNLYHRVRKIYKERRNDLALLMLDFRYRIYAESRETNPESRETNAESRETEDVIRETEVGRMIERIREAQRQYGKADRRHKAGTLQHLQQWADEMEAPDVSINWDGNNATNYPGAERRLLIDSRNVKELEVRIFRVKGLNNRDEALDRCPSDYRRRPGDYYAKKGDKSLVLTLHHSLRHLPAHQSFADTLSFTLPEAGIYIVEMLADGSLRDSDWLTVSGVTAVTTHYNSVKGAESRLAIVDTYTGEHITDDVHLYVCREPGSPGIFPKDKVLDDAAAARSWQEVLPSMDGFFDVTDYDYRYRFAIAAGDDAFFPSFTSHGNHLGPVSTSDVVASYGRIFTDRAIYRPGQKVQVSGLVYSRLNDDYQAAEGWRGTLVLQNTERKDVAEVPVTTDEYGQFVADFDLPDPTIPGRFSLVLRGGGVRTTEYISVEQYKRPTFRIVLDAASPREIYDKGSYERGDTLVLRGRVETFSGLAVADASVKWITERTGWSWLRSYSDDRGAVAEGEVTTDADGRFVLRVALQDEGCYRTSCEALAPNGETATQSHSLYVGHPVPPSLDGEGQEHFELFTVNTRKTGDEARLVLDLRALPQGVERPVYLFYDVVSTLGGLVESQRYRIDADQTQYELKWRKDYGDGAAAYVAFLKDGILYRSQMTVQRPAPEKELKLQWSTFRNNLQPGQDETWTLSVRRPDGTPVEARVMARLYDASLDAFARSPWHFGLSFDRRLPVIYSVEEALRFSYLRWHSATPECSALNFTCWEPTMFDYYAYMARPLSLRKSRASRLVAEDSFAGGTNGKVFAAQKLMASPAMMEESAEVLREVPVQIDALSETAEDSTAAEAAQMQVRENFNETAFFLPALRTDAAGNVTISFTLPESLTQWNFTALAHERDMNYGLLNDTIVAQKKLMTEIAAPRFLRAGDKTEIPVTVRNLTDTEQQGELIFLVTDAATGQPLKTEKRSFVLASTTDQDVTGSQTTLFFPLTTTCDVNVRAVAKTADFSDGEERNIPFIDGREAVQVSIPFSSTQKGTLSLDLAPLKLAQLMKKDAQCRPTLTVEYCANPVWNVVRVVPALLEGEAYSANDWAVRLYTIEVADFLSRQLKKTESAVLVDSLVAAKDIAALRYAARDHLADFQLGNGGFSWFKGFYASPWITADVCVLLARQQKMTGSTTACKMLSNAVNYLSGMADEWVKDMKKQNAASVPEVMMRYLYVRQLLGLAPGKTEQYLLDLAAKEKKELTMYGKSVLAQIAMDSHQTDAILALESLIEHTVSTPEMGRYFDTERAFGGWASYRIPTQTMAIEALGRAGQTELQEEMKLWLLQSKRTQKWESSRASADATYALLHGEGDAADSARPFQTLTPESYLKRQLTADEAARAIHTDSYNIIKETDGLSWGALYADYTLPAEQVEASGAGFTLTRTWEVLREGKWVPLSGTTSEHVQTFTLKVGEHVRQTIALRADRDYDFVQVECSRAACLEPLAPLSGLCRLGGIPAYRMVRDSRNDYFFEHLAKGIHTFSEELIVDRGGTFTTGIVRVQCTFAPEFRAYAPTFKLKVTKM